MNKDEIAKILNDIEESIQKKIETHENSLSKLDDESKKQFIKGCICGLHNALLSIPLIETIGVECDDV
jgi:hypothetical protein